MDRLSYFRCDVTPPIGHPLMGGLSTPARRIVDRQWAHGLLLEGDAAPLLEAPLLEAPMLEEPLLLVTVDWCLIRNRGYARWREVLAEAAATTPQRVFVHTVHQHDAVLADPGMEEVLAEYGLGGQSLDLGFFETTLQTVAKAVRESKSKGRTVTHVSRGEAAVEDVASNRRIVLEGRGREPLLRRSWCRDAALQAAPLGLIDPYMKTIGFWNGEELLAALHYYATHPMSFYGEGGVSRDFCGLARDRLAAETGAPQLYFSGAGGNISAGKYNDGSPAMSRALEERLLDGMRASLQKSVRQPLESIGWKSVPLHLAARPEFSAGVFRSRLADTSKTAVERCWGALGLASVNYREEAPNASDMSCLQINDIRVLQLPGEPFIEYQLFAQQTAPERFVALAAYGDGGPGYLPTATAFAARGYEVGGVAFADASCEATIKQAIQTLLS